MAEENELGKLNNNYTNLLIVLKSILKQLGFELEILEEYKEINFEEAIILLNQLMADNGDNNFDLFKTFIKKMFLDDKWKLDFDLNLLYKLIDKSKFEKIMEALYDGINEFNFFTFLKEISQIFCSFYFINQKVQDFINPYMNQCQNCYQCILTLLLSCKKEKVEELFLGTYKEYFEIVYEKYIYENVNYIIKKHYDLLYEKNIRKNLSEEDIEEIVSEIRINMMEYFCHCNLFYKDEYKNFFEIFFNFFTERKDFPNYFEKSTYLEERIINEYEYEYLKEIIHLLTLLFNDFRNESIEKFKISLYSFISEFKKRYKNSFIDNAFKIGTIYNLTNEDIAIVSMILFSKDFIKQLEDISKRDEKAKNDYLTIINLNKQEIIVYKYINDNKFHSIQQDNENVTDIENKNNNQLMIESKKDYNSQLNKESDLITNELLNINKKELNLKNDDIESKIELIFNNKISKISENFKKINCELNEKLNKIIEENNQLNEKFTKENNKLKKEIDYLKEIHQKIYFRDVSKHYILQFGRQYLNILNLDAYHVAMKILRVNFGKNNIPKKLQNPMNKIICHYLEGNKLAHLDYFVSKELKANSSKNKIFEEIIKSYSKFMNLSEYEIKDLRANFKDRYTINKLLNNIIL